jgi:hypothetical protein
MKYSCSVRCQAGIVSPDAHRPTCYQGSAGVYKWREQASPPYCEQNSELLRCNEFVTNPEFCCGGGDKEVCSYSSNAELVIASLDHAVFSHCMSEVSLIVTLCSLLGSPSEVVRGTIWNELSMDAVV